MFFSFAVVNNNILAAIGKPKKVTFIILLAAFVNVVLNLLFIPSHGMLGAAWATVVAYIFILLLSTYFVIKSIKVAVPFFDWIKIFLSGIIFLIVVDFLRKSLILNVWLEIFVVILLGLVVYFLLLIFFRINLFYFSTND